MKAGISTVSVLIFFSGLKLCSLYAQQSPIDEDKRKLSVSLTPGYFQEDFKWSIAGNIHGQDPNILSELIWENLKGPCLAMTVKWNPWKSLYLKTNVAASFITSGAVSDTDYLTDDRTNATFKMTFDSDRGTTRSFIVQTGYAIMHTENFQVTAYLGYGRNQQSLFLLGEAGNEALRSSYETVWKGPVATLDARRKLAKHFFIEPSFYYHQLHYNAEANWNLIENFKHPVSFEHSAKGYRAAISNKVLYRFDSGFSLSVIGSYSFSKTGKGNDKLYLSNNTVANTQFNGASGKTFALGIEAAMAF